MSRLFSLRKVCTAGALCLTLAAAALPAGAATLVVAATKTPGGFDGDALKPWALAGELASVFEKYQAWRRDWLLRWEAGADRDDPQARLCIRLTWPAPAPLLP